MNSFINQFQVKIRLITVVDGLSKKKLKKYFEMLITHYPRCITTAERTYLEKNKGIYVNISCKFRFFFS